MADNKNTQKSEGEAFGIAPKDPREDIVVDAFAVIDGVKTKVGTASPLIEGARGVNIEPQYKALGAKLGMITFSDEEE